MLYRGFETAIDAGSDIQRQNHETQKIESCLGYYCRVFKDGVLSEVYDEFTLALGYDIPDTNENTVHRAVIKHIDDNIAVLRCAKALEEHRRNNSLFAALIRRLKSSDDKEKLYHLLHGECGLSDEEIWKLGFLELVPCFNQAEYAHIIARYMIEEGTQQTMSGNLHFEFQEINEKFGVNLPTNKDLLDDIVEELWSCCEVVADVITDKDFDLMFYLDFCPCAREDENDD